MKRELKFRCFDTLSPKMYVGHSLTISANGSISFLDDTGNWIEPEEGRIVIMQYTGLKDKAGKEIHEGDIVQSNNCLPEDTGDYEVRFENGAYHLFWVTGHWHCGFSQEEIDALNLEVIGNICENPELIK